MRMTPRTALLTSAFVLGGWANSASAQAPAGAAVPGGYQPTARSTTPPAQAPAVGLPAAPKPAVAANSRAAAGAKPTVYWGPAPPPVKKKPSRFPKLRGLLGFDDEPNNNESVAIDRTTGRTNVGLSKPWMKADH